MKHKKATFTQSPFGNLKRLIEEKRIELRQDDKTYQSKPATSDIERDPADERRIFLEAMSDVVPLKKKRHLRVSRHPHKNDSQFSREKNSDSKALENLIKSGKGFVIAQTAEYMEGINSTVHPDITRLLHRGHFAIQDHIDLHGLNVENAKRVFDNFMKESVVTRKKGILIVHGRGLSSPVEPVLKNRVYQWLSSGPWRKWVIAFSSARACDGGAGATYVLLRDHPISKRQQRKKQSMPY